MNRYLLLILLSSWAHVVPLSLQCDTGNAHADHVLSVPRSLMANADVALLKTYNAETLDKCITECCTEKFGSCSVASFKKNNTEVNCQHFNCRPVDKCIFLSSNSTDSFSFPSSSSPHILVPSSHASKNDSLSSTVATFTTAKNKISESAQNKQVEYGVTKEVVASYTEEQFALKNDNTTVKPRKGVDDTTENFFENANRSGVKPRKGVSFDAVVISKVKPRKGVEPYQPYDVVVSTDVKPLIHQTTTPFTTDHHSTSSSFISAYQNILAHDVFSKKVKPVLHQTTSPFISDYHSTSSSVSRAYQNVLADDVVSALEKVFEDDTKVIDIKPSTTTSSSEGTMYVPTTNVVVHSLIPTVVSSVHATSFVEKSTSSVLQSSLATNYVVSSSVQTPNLVSTSVKATETVSRYPVPSASSPSILEHSKLLFHEFTIEDGIKSEESNDYESLTESESERKYKSSMHLVLSLVFGLLVLFSVLGVVAKRVYDSWMRRHYRRMDFLIDGMYNGYG